MTSKLRKFRVTILCEDIAHHRFIREYLICQGLNKRDILDFGNVKSRNNGSVIRHYPDLVREYRKKKNYQNIALVVMLDADGESAEYRLRAFGMKLDRGKTRLNQKTRWDNERIAIFIPARNIETWIHYSLGDMDCNEDDDYKKYYTADDAGKAAKIFANKICVDGLPQNALSSLHHACAELERLKKI
ncbi:hypothetical protein QUF72_08060 [Desulfobacterales bacterium HSG2]|nr:hypothetical protein [Desulfobacterales bacterium HSG2]